MCRALLEKRSVCLGLLWERDWCADGSFGKETCAFRAFLGKRSVCVEFFWKRDMCF